MELTFFLARVWGIIAVTIGLGIFINRNFYSKLYRDFGSEPLAILTFSIIGIILGFIHISIHNVWGNFSQVIISLFGWGLLIKGVAFATVPKLVERSSNFIARAKVLPWSGVLIIIIGVYLSWIGFF